MAKIFDHDQPSPEALFDADRYTKPAGDTGEPLANPDAVVDSTTAPTTTEQQVTDEPIAEPVDANDLVLADDTGNDQPSNKKRNAVLAAAGSAGLAVLLYLGINSASSDDPDRSPEAVSAIDTEDPSVNDTASATEGPIADVPEASEATPNAPGVAIPEGFIEPEPGFVVPETRTGFPDNPPEIRETNDADEALSQLAEIVAYIESTGDFSYLQYLTDNEIFIDRTKTNYNNKLIMEEQYLLYDYYYWRSYTPSRPHEAHLDAEKGFETVEVNSAKVGFSDDQYSNEGQMFSSFERYEMTLIPKRVSYEGREMTIWVIGSTGPATFEVFNDPYDMYTNDGH